MEAIKKSVLEDNEHIGAKIEKTAKSDTLSSTNQLPSKAKVYPPNKNSAFRQRKTIEGEGEEMHK